jgi:FkbH-like protein
VLRDKFGKPRVGDEDRIRAASLRQSASFSLSGGATASDEFIESTQPVVNLNFCLDANDRRALELVNKTNQFNMNGVRYSEADWKARLRRPGSFLLTVQYEDRFGPLGRIAVLSGTVRRPFVEVDTWVMSCRAFSRRIEHQCLSALFERFNVEEIHIDRKDTDRNGPFRDFVAAISDERSVIRREVFEARRPPLYFTVRQQEGTDG